MVGAEVAHGAPLFRLSRFGLPVKAVGWFVVGVANGFRNQTQNAASGDVREVVIEAAVRSDGDELQAVDGEGTTDEPEVLGDAEIVTVGGCSGADWFVFVEVVVRTGIERVEFVCGETRFFASLDKLPKRLFWLISHIDLFRSLPLRSGWPHVHFGSGEVDDAKSQPIEDIDGLDHRVGPVDDAGVMRREKVGEAAVAITVEEVGVGAFANLEGGLGNEIGGPAAVQKLHDAGVKIERAVEADGWVVGCPESGSQQLRAGEVDTHFGEGRRSDFHVRQSVERGAAADEPAGGGCGTGK